MNAMTMKPVDVVRLRLATMAEEVAAGEVELKEKANALREATSKLWADLDADDIVVRALDLAEHVGKMRKKKAALDAARRMS